MSEQVIAKFVRTTNNPKFNGLKVIYQDGTEDWADCSPQVLGFVKNNNSINEGVDIVMIGDWVQKGQKRKFNVTKVQLNNTYNNVQPPQMPMNTQNVSTPSTNIVQPPVQMKISTPSVVNFNKYRDPAIAERMCRLSILSSVCTAVSAVQGYIDLNTLDAKIECLYDYWLNKIKN